jgi:hypothetical protein
VLRAERCAKDQVGLGAPTVGDWLWPAPEISDDKQPGHLLCIAIQVAGWETNLGKFVALPRPTSYRKPTANGQPRPSPAGGRRDESTSPMQLVLAAGDGDGDGDPSNRQPNFARWDWPARSQACWPDVVGSRDAKTPIGKPYFKGLPARDWPNQLRASICRVPVYFWTLGILSRLLHFCTRAAGGHAAFPGCRTHRGIISEPDLDRRRNRTDLGSFLFLSLPGVGCLLPPCDGAWGCCLQRALGSPSVGGADRIDKRRRPGLFCMVGPAKRTRDSPIQLLSTARFVLEGMSRPVPPAGRCRAASHGFVVDGRGWCWPCFCRDCGFS